VIALTDFVRAGDGVWWGQGAAEPTPLVDALVDAVPEIGPVHAFVGLCWNPRIAEAPPEQLTLTSYGALGDLRHLPPGRLTVLRQPLSAIPRLFADGGIPADVGLLQGAPPDADGMCALGLGTEYAWDAVQHTRTLIAEVNAGFPGAAHGPRLPLERFAGVVRTDRAPLELPVRPPRAVDTRVAAHVAALVEDGDTIQIGIGQIPSAVLAQLTGHTDLGVHSGVVTDGIAELVVRGVVTGARKGIDDGLVVSGTAMGSAGLYRSTARPPYDFRPVSYTHSPTVLARLHRFVAINSAVEVDLTGAVNAEVRDGRVVGAIGGQADFARAAHTGHGLSVIALPATTHGRSTIVPRVATVSTPAAHIDVVATEHGVAHLSGCAPDERARRLISIAAPEHREDLSRSLAAVPATS
jgi:acyl-CoA hydrolase